MRQLVLGMALIIILYPHAIFSAVEAGLRLQIDPTDVHIVYPVEGQVLQGEVAIQGSIGKSEILSYEVDFAYALNPTDTWFLIQEGTRPVENDILATWNTTEIADGEYSLRLLVRMANGMTQLVMVNGLRVTNDAPIESSSPLPTVERMSNNPGLPLTSTTLPNPTNATLFATTTPLSPNPIVISPSQVYTTLGKGVGITLGSFAMLGMYLGLRHRSAKRR